MKSDNIQKAPTDRVWLSQADCDIEDFAALVSRQATRSDYPLASDIQENVPVYDCGKIRSAAHDATACREMMAEWVKVLTNGPGVLVLAGAFADPTPVDAVTVEFQAMIEEQREAGIASREVV